MGSEVIIMPIMILGVFGIAYYYLTTRNRERLALIEAGADAKLFKTANNGGWHFVIVLGMLAIGIALGTGVGALIDQALNGNGAGEGAYIFGIFFFGGLSLLTSFFLIRKIKKQDGE